MFYDFIFLINGDFRMRQVRQLPWASLFEKQSVPFPNMSAKLFQPFEIVEISKKGFHQEFGQLGASHEFLPEASKIFNPPLFLTLHSLTLFILFLPVCSFNTLIYS